MAGTSVPDLQFTLTGVVAPAETAVLAGVQADIDAAFGGGVDPSLTTPQGQLAQSDAAIVGAKNDAILAIVNGIDPAYAAGRMQDAIARIYFLTRKPALPTTVQCVCTGIPNTVIPAGSLATDGTNLWACQTNTTIPAGGSISTPFACSVTGPIACPSNTVSRIYQTISGWDTINNPSAGVLGTDVESRADFEHRRQQSVASNAQGVMGAVLGAVLNVADVTDAWGYNNGSNSSTTQAGVSIPANSVYISVAGGDPQAVAQAIWSKMGPGASYTGNTTETVLDTNPLYALPYPSYTVKFETPTALPILFAVNIANSAQVPADATAQIQNAIIAAFAGADGGQRARIASTLYASRYYAPVANLGAWAQIVDILVGTSSPTAYSVAVHGDQVPTIQASNIAVALV